MSVMNMVQAINNAFDIKLAEDKSVVMFGEDVGVEGGVFRVTEGLQKKYGTAIPKNKWFSPVQFL